MSQFKWYCCPKCNVVEEYAVFDNGDTSFPRGEYLAHRDYFVSGFPTKEEAEQWLKEHPLES
jgi:hypothetical protein